MNNLEILIKADDGATGGTSKIKYILSNEKYFLINMADDQADDELDQFLDILKTTYPNTYDIENQKVDLSLDPTVPYTLNYLWKVEGSFGAPLSSLYANSGFVLTDSADYSEIVLNLEAPINITFNPATLKSLRKTYKMEYLFEEGTQTQTFFYAPTAEDTGLPFIEPGDPRNFPKTSTYTLTDSFEKTIYTLIRYHTYGQVQPSEILYTINLKSPYLDGQFGLFNEVHLIGSKMFDFDNKILYMFESYNPQYLLPALVKWDDVSNSNLIKNVASKRLILKPYRIIAPFEDDNQEKQDITSINLNDYITHVIDDGFTQQNNITVSNGGYYILTNGGQRIRIGTAYNSNLNYISNVPVYLMTEDGFDILSENLDKIDVR